MVKVRRKRAPISPLLSSKARVLNIFTAPVLPPASALRYLVQSMAFIQRTTQIVKE